jgi:hypothetical protein
MFEDGGGFIFYEVAKMRLSIMARLGVTGGWLYIDKQGVYFGDAKVHDRTDLA